MSNRIQARLSIDNALQNVVIILLVNQSTDFVNIPFLLSTCLFGLHASKQDYGFKGVRHTCIKCALKYDLHISYGEVVST